MPIPVPAAAVTMTTLPSKRLCPDGGVMSGGGGKSLFKLTMGFLWVAVLVQKGVQGLSLQ